jgi:hypothetical protein
MCVASYSSPHASFYVLHIHYTPPLLQEMKLRLISIFIITQKGITDSEKEELFLAAQLSANERQVKSQIILSCTGSSIVCTVIRNFVAWY